MTDHLPGSRPVTAPADPGEGNRWADCGVCVEVPTVTGWALGRQDRCPVHGRQPFPDGEQSQFDDWRPPQEMVDDLVEAWHTQPDQLLDDFMRDLLRRWHTQGRLAQIMSGFTPDPADVALVAKVFITEARKNPVTPSPYSWGVTSRLLLGPNEHDIARAVLAALAESGRSLPPETATRIEHAVKLTWDDGDVAYDVHGREYAERLAAFHAKRRAAGPWRIVSAEVVQRTVTTSIGPWASVSTTPETPE